MSDQSLIILLTKTFPFSTGEEFLEEEINILANHFPDIIVIATSVPAGAIMTRAIPENVRCYALFETSNRIRKYTRYVLKGSRSILENDVREELRGKRIKGILGTIYISGRSRNTARRISEIPGIMDEISDKKNILIYSYWFVDLPYTALLIKKSVNNDNIKIISRAHGYDLYEYRNPSGCIPFRESVLSGIDRVFTCSNNGRDYLREKYPGYASKIEASYLGTRDYGEGNHKENDHFRIVTCSSIIPLKRVSMVAEALRLLEEKNIICNWLCIGDGPLLSDLKEYVRHNLNKSHVTFTGMLKHDYVLKLLKNSSADLFINVSQTEGLPVSIMEAASFGIPVLATNVGGVSEIVDAQDKGVLIEADATPEILADTIEECMQNKFDRFGIRNSWKNKFNSECNYKAFSETIHGILMDQ